MSTPGKRKHRNCLICCIPVTGVHSGFDICRACATFFKRTYHRRATLVCRQGNSKCSVRKEEHFMCKKCRLDKCIAIGMKGCQASTSKKKCECNLPDVSSAIAFNEEECESLALNIPQCSRSLETPTQPLLLNTVATRFRLMQSFRRASELTLLMPSQPLGCALCSTDLPLQLASFQSLNMVHKILASALCDFANSSFEDFRLLTSEERFAVMSRCHMAILVADGCYRTTQKLPGASEMCLIGMNFYFTNTPAVDFFADAPAPDRHTDAAKIFRSRFETLMTKIYSQVARLQMTEREVHALIVLLFCSNDTEISDAVAAFSYKHRARSLFELQRSFQEDGLISDEESAVRICRLMQLTFSLKEAASEIVRDIEIYRLLDIVNDENIIVQVCGATREQHSSRLLEI